MNPSIKKFLESRVTGHVPYQNFISNNVGPVKHFLSRLIHSPKRVFSSACWVVFLVGLDDFGSFVI